MPRPVLLLQHLGAQDVAGHQVRRELHPAELQLQRLPQRAHQQRLAQPRHAFKHAVAPGKQRHQQLLNHLFLTYHGLADGLAQADQVPRQVLDIGFGQCFAHAFEFTSGGTHAVSA